MIIVKHKEKILTGGYFDQPIAISLSPFNLMSMEWLLDLKDWFIGLGEQYNVNPIIFGSIYVGAVPFFLLSLRWLVKRLKQRKPIVIPLLLTGFFFVSAYLYLVIAGRNIPLWVYFVIGAMIVYGMYSTILKITKKIKSAG